MSNTSATENAASPGNHPDHTPENKNDEIRGIELALTKLADDYKKAAERHLIRAALGLVIGFFTALLLPVAFTLIDAYVERQLLDWRTKITIGGDPQTDNGVTEEFTKVGQQSARYRQDKKQILRQAYDTRFGTVVFRNLPRVQESASIRLNFNSQQTISCPDLDGDVVLQDLRVSGALAGVIGVGENTQQYQGKPAFVFQKKTAGNCEVTALDLPDFDALQGTIVRLDRENIGTVDDGSGLVIPAFSTSPATSSEVLIGVVICLTESGELKNGLAPCRLISTPEGSGKAEVSRIVMNEIGSGLGLLVSLRNGGSKLLSIIVDNSNESRATLDTLRLTEQSLQLKSGINQIFVRDREVFIQGSSYSEPAQILRLSQPLDETLSPEVRSVGSIALSDSTRIVDLTYWNGKTVALVTRQDQDTALALSGASGLIYLNTASDSSGTEQFDELHIAEDGSGKPLLFLQRRREGPTYSGVQTQHSYAADIEKVARLFESSDPLAPVPAELEATVFAEELPWEGRDVLIPANDRTTVDRARAIKPVLDAFEAAENSFVTIQKNLNTSRTQLAEAQQKVKDTESDIAFWSTIAARVVVIALIFYFVQLEMSLNRYNARLSGHYRARSLAVRYLLSTGRGGADISFEDLFAAIVAIDSKEITEKEPPGPPTDKLLTFLQSAIRSKEKPAA